jgi:hypothetical protein
MNLRLDFNTSPKLGTKKYKNYFTITKNKKTLRNTSLKNANSASNLNKLNKKKTPTNIKISLKPSV